jgi:diketogulonate reductase-like aldo/keto reductase
MISAKTRSFTVHRTEIPQNRLRGHGRSTARTRPDGVRDAMDIGYRHIDHRRPHVRETRPRGRRGIVATGIDRGELWLTTKIWPRRPSTRPPEGRRGESLRTCGSRVRRLLLLAMGEHEVDLEHSCSDPSSGGGRIRHAGVSNFPAGGRWRARSDSVADAGGTRSEYHPVHRPGRAARPRRPRRAP